MALNALKRRRSIRSFDTTMAITQEQRKEIAEAALLSPTSMNKQDIDLIWITNPDRIKEISKTAYEALPKEKKAQFDIRHGKYDVGDIITGDSKDILLFVKNERASQVTELNCGIIAMGAMIAAQEFNIDSMILGCIRQEKVEQLLGLQKGQLVLGLAFGYRKKKPVIDPKEIVAKVTYIE